MNEQLTEHDIALLRTMADEYDALAQRWKEARPMSQEVANLHSTYNARNSAIGRAVEGGLFRRILVTLDSAIPPSVGSGGGREEAPSDLKLALHQLHQLATHFHGTNADDGQCDLAMNFLSQFDEDGNRAASVGSKEDQRDGQQKGGA